MEEFIPFGTGNYWLFLGLILVARLMDILSTRVATPNLVLEGNPIAKYLGWRWGIVVNLSVCFSIALWPFLAIGMSTFSVLVAARNFQAAWVMRSMGEEAYRDWYVTRLQETRITLYLSCLAGQVLSLAAIGTALIYFSRDTLALAPLGIGMGIITYAGAIAIFSLHAVWRLRRAGARKQPATETQRVRTNGHSAPRPETADRWAPENVRPS
jgi:hypothetical protein